MPSDFARMATLFTTILRSPFTWFAILLLTAEYVAHQLSPMRDLPNATEVIRNPLGSDRYGWPEYLDGQLPPRKRLVALVSNSQGHAIDTAADQIYPTLLKANLELQHPDVVFENWSVPGLRLVETDVLAILAAERRAELIVFLGNFQGNRQTPEHLDLDYPDSDTSLLMGNPLRWRYVLTSSFSDRTTSDTLLLKSAQLVSNFVRSRDILNRSLEKERPNDWGKLLYPHYGERYLRKKEKRRKKKERQAGVKIPEPNRQEKGNFDALRMATQSINHVLSNAGVKSLWIWQPTPKFARTPARRENEDESENPHLPLSLPQGAFDAVDSSGLEQLDMTASIPIQEFRNKSTHFTATGHQHMADLLMPIISRELQ